MLLERLGKPWPEVLAAHLGAFEHRPDRVEPLYRIGMHYQHAGEYRVAHLFLARAQSLPVPAGNRLFVEQALYDYLVPLEYAVCCYYVGLHAEAIATNDRLLSSGMLPADLVGRVIENRQFSLDALSRRIAESD